MHRAVSGFLNLTFVIHTMNISDETKLTTGRKVGLNTLYNCAFRVGGVVN